VIHLYQSHQTEKFIQHSKIAADTPESRLQIENAIRDAGHSPVGQKLMSKLMNADNVEFLETHSGSHVDEGTNTMHINIIDFSDSAYPDPGITIVHEMGHTISGGYNYNATQEHLNVRDTENRYRWWMGITRRSVYENMYTGDTEWNQEEFSYSIILKDAPVPRVGFWEFLIHPSY